MPKPVRAMLIAAVSAAGVAVVIWMGGYGANAIWGASTVSLLVSVGNAAAGRLT